MDKETVLANISHRKRPFVVRAVSVLEKLFVYAIVKAFGWMAYDTKYLRGRWFEGFRSAGYRWAFNGMMRKLFTGYGRGILWPISSRTTVGESIEFHVDDLNLFQGNVYYQTLEGGHISIGRGCWIANGCALITSNHDLLNPDDHLQGKNISIGDHSWLGTNVVVTPGVELGPHTVVGANAVVTKSFPEGYCVLAGVPAKKIRDLPKEKD